MELARREFLKESMATLGFLALPGGLFAVPTGWKPKGKKPNHGVTEVGIPVSELPPRKEADNWRQAVQLARHEGEIDLDHF